MTFEQMIPIVAQIDEKIAKKVDVSQSEAGFLMSVIQHMFSEKSGISFWKTIPIPVDMILLSWNGRTLTPPMSFKSEDEVQFFTGMHKPIAYLEIPKPPDLPENLRKIQENGHCERN